MKTKKVIIASKNPVKINAVKLGFKRMFPEEYFEYQGISVPSEVSDQPLSDDETLKGAKNRTANARKVLPQADFWVGVEGGIQIFEKNMGALAWIVVRSNELEGKARTGTFFLPQKVVELIHQGMELGDADDIVFGKSNSKQENGAVGLLTDNVMTRMSFYMEAVTLALIPFKNLKLYHGQDH